MMETWRLEMGASALPGGGALFRVWAPRARRVAVKLLEPSLKPTVMHSGPDGIFEVLCPEGRDGTDYVFVLDGAKERPDPVSRWQPNGVHGASRIVDPASFRWTDAGWPGIPLEAFVFYELHVGTFTPEGTFDAIIARLPYLRQLGVTAVECMPVAAFPGGRNWGYDGVFPYAPQSSYGGPAGLKRLVDACHREGLVFVLDVVYNHLGPEGNYLADFGPYFTNRYRTPWGQAINLDGPDSDLARRYFLNNALYWLTEYHVDALRLDAIHGIFDFSARHILEEMAEEFHAQARRLGRQAWLIAESDLNDPRVIRPPVLGGYGIDAQWSDDFHHSLHAVVNGTRRGYFRDFGTIDDLRKSIEVGFVYDGRRSVYRRRRHGASSTDRPGRQFVVSIQNHDQVANACQGDRFGSVASLEQQKLAACLLLCAPNLPLLFMGEEYAETAPFFYFTSHGDPDLAEAVRNGRREEFAAFGGTGEFPDPQSEATFERSKLDLSRSERAPHRDLLRWYRDLLAIRKRFPCLSNGRKDLTSVWIDEEGRWMVIERRDPSGDAALILVNLAPHANPILVAAREGRWELALSSAQARYGASSNPAQHPSLLDFSTDEGKAVECPSWSAALYLQKEPYP
jgi:maltooligosyltrehalose trehalohydrolase